jgi:hypothetical protein
MDLIKEQFKKKIMKNLIQDTKTKEYYAVECSENSKGFLTSANDEGNTGDNDFPYWTDDIF